MANRLQRDFTRGSIVEHLISFSLPMFAGSLLQATYSIVNSIWVGRFMGPGALGAVSISFPLIMALLSLVMGLTMATTTLVAQFRGAGNEPMVRRSVATSLSLLGVVGLALSATGVIFRYPLLGLVNPPEELKKMAADYFGIFMAGMVFMFLYNVLTAILRGLGDARTPLVFLIISTITNVVLDPLLIIGVGPFPKLGVAGAALATVFSQGLASLLLWRWVRRNTSLLPESRADWCPDFGIVKSVLRIGMPTGIQQTLVSFGMVAVTAVISSFGTTVVAAFGAASRFDNFGWLPAMNIGMAVTSMVGQNLGAGKLDRVRSTVRWSCVLAAGLTAVISVVAVLWPTILMVLFTDDQAVLLEGAKYLRIMGPTYIPFSLIFIFGGVMRGAGDTVPPMIFTIVALWLFRVPLAFWLSRSMGSQGIWVGIAISAVVGLLLHWAYYATGRWRRKAVGYPTPAAEAPVSLAE
ncbi:MAG TPA: MATE family efflux transporter [Symbiobacteriaceae bacterium]|nr:MATE family efflux transporter [Symbiobacteriaceae bacterium]